MCIGGTPKEEVEYWECGYLANSETSVNGGWKLVSIGLCVFSGSFGVRSIVLCKCSGKVLTGYKR